ncbi:class I SAM-dependent methyltransferase [Patescibacteria group bacterium AH-259-L07]|nr:class I SAM-dependent methyltransferase [Patescibacteria group bacterium AH-259-L07]
MKLYDKKNKRILMFEERATPHHWDAHWDTDNFIEKVKAGKNNRFIKKFTTKFLNPGAKILEGGCGIGQNVYGLQQWGYQAYGVDFAKKTIEKINRNFPELKISIADVKKLNFPNNFFDGYWSLGVIEHFQNGYDEILKEMKRVIKSQGYLFVTFPYMSPFRRLRANLGMYKSFENTYKADNFYQFLLDDRRVTKDFEKYGFKLISKYPYNPVKGIKSEINFLKPVLQKVYDGKNIFTKGVRFLISLLLSKFAGHCILLVFQKL